jgi:hypothetical protein
MVDSPHKQVPQQYFAKVAALGPDSAVLSGHRYSEDEQRITRLALVEHGIWRHFARLPEIVSSIVALEEGGRVVFYAMLRNGVLHRWAEAQHSVEIIEPERGYLFSELRQIGAHLYACGSGRQVVRREGTRWVRFDDEIVMSKPTSGLTSIDGNSEVDVYAVGLGGDLFHHDGRNWSKLESPTNFGLNCVRCFDGVTYVCGYHGLFMRGGTRAWEVLSGERGHHHLWSIAGGFDRIFFSSEYEIFTYAAGSITQVELPFLEDVTFGAMTFGFGKLWIAASAGVVQFDGEEWTLIECPWTEEKDKPEDGKGS